MKKKKNMQIVIIISLAVILIGLILFLILRNNKNDGGNDEEKTTTTTTTTKVVKIVNEASKTRPYAVMINNVDGARKLQSGLQDAYIIYEMMVEGGITRYLALFMDKDVDRIGSIRSARHYYLDYALENDAIYVHHGYSPQAKSDWNSLGVDRIEVNESSTGWRDKSASKTYEYTLFTSTDKLSHGLGKKRVERKNDLLLNYSADEVDIANMEGVISANNVYIKYSNTTKNNYVYDVENKVYLRSVNGKEQKDYVTGKQLSVKNIIVYDVKYSKIPGDTYDRQNIDNIGSGKGYFITSGYAVPITWEKKDRKSQTVYKYLDGKEIIVNDGNTFIQIMPSGQSLEIS